MARFDFDVAIIGSGFGGSVAALRAAEKGYRVGVMESGKRWKDEDIPKTQWDQRRYLWLPAAEMYGMQRIEFLDDVLVLSGAGVGGGSHVYANTLYVPPKQFFDAAEWAVITDWADELAPCIDQARRMLGVVRYPYMPTDLDRYMQRGHQAAARLGLPAGRPGHAAPPSRPRRRSRRAATRREEVRHHPRLPLLNRGRRLRRKPMTDLAADAFRTVGWGDAIPNDYVVPYYLDDRKLRISIARVDDRLFAFDDLCTCTPDACPLSGGLLTGTTIMCQCHGSRFDLTTGAVINGPATEPLNVYEVQEVEGRIRLSGLRTP